MVTPTANSLGVSQFYVSDTAASATTYTGCPTNAVTAYTTGMMVNFKPATNSGDVGTHKTLNLCGLGAKNIFRVDGASDLTNGEFLAGQWYQLRYDGTEFTLTTPTFPRELVTLTLPSSDTVTCNTTANPGNTFASAIVIPGNSIGNKNVFEVQIDIQDVYSGSPPASFTTNIQIGGTTSVTLANASTGLTSLTTTGSEAFRIIGTAAPANPTTFQVISENLFFSLAAATSASLNTTANITIQPFFKCAAATGGNTRQIIAYRVFQTN
jgi:hypothetical protein